jgi:RNA-directed DNA polymerase
MDAATPACAPSGVAWDGISWANVQIYVRRLQTRIVKATQEGRHNKAKALQWLLTHSFSGKALAVKRVTENKGKNTPGVDKVTWKTPGAKTNAIASLKRRGYSPLPLRRVSYSEEKWQDEATRHPGDEMPRHASAPSAGVGTHC